MAVKIRLARVGARNRPFYRIVVSDVRAPRDGGFIEQVGTYDPGTEPPSVTLKSKRLEHWLGRGAQPTQTVSQLISRAGKGSAASAEVSES